MGNNESFVVVRELYPETKGSFFKSKRCPKVDDALEFAYGMDSTGATRRLDDEKSRDTAAKRGDRIFAVSKRHVDFATAFVKVCKEDGYEWNYSMEGTIKIVDPSKFLCAWASDEGACGLNGINSDGFAHRVLASFEPTVRDEIMVCRREHGYRIRDIEEKDALPSSFWSQAFANSGVPQAGGLAIEVSDKAFLSPDRDMEAKINAAAETQRELENKAKVEWQAVVNGKLAEAEIVEIEMGRERAQLQFEKEKADIEAAIKKQKVDIAVYEANQLNEAKIRLQKALNDEEIRKQQAVGGIESGQVQAMSSAMNEVLSKLAAVMDKLGNLGVAAADVSNKAPAVVQDPVVAPRYQGMSDNFLSVMKTLKDGADEGVMISLEAARRSDDYATRDLMPVRRRNDRKKVEGVLHIGDRMTLRLKSPRSGYLTLFNFGTSGKVLKMFPHPAFGTTDSYIKADCVYMLPGELMPADVLSDGEWEEQGPVSSRFGLSELVVAVLTDERVNLDESCFGAQVSRALTRGGFDAVEESISSILDLPAGSWIWGMVGARVED